MRTNRHPLLSYLHILICCCSGLKLTPTVTFTNKSVNCFIVVFFLAQPLSAERKDLSKRIGAFPPSHPPPLVALCHHGVNTLSNNFASLYSDTFHSLQERLVGQLKGNGEAKETVARQLPLLR